METIVSRVVSKINKYYGVGEVQTIDLQTKLPEESVGRYIYRKKLSVIIKKHYKVKDITAELIAKQISDQYFLGTKYLRDNDLDAIIKDISNKMDTKVNDESR